MDVRKVLTDSDIKPIKKLDQFFLQNEDILRKEVQLADLKSSDTVLEIGAGPGNLTGKIAEKAHVIAIERDKRFIPLLEGIDNTQVMCGNAVKLIKDLQFNKIVSNIPYSASKKLILQLLRKEWEIAVLIVQKEFADKLQSISRIALIVEDCAGLEVVGTIGAGEFYPPAAESSLIVLKQKRVMDEKFWLFINELFRHKNKDTGNVVGNCPEKFAKKKVQHLNLEEVKEIYRLASL